MTFWAGDLLDAEGVRRLASEQLVRLEWQDRHGHADTVAALTAQEGLAMLRSAARPTGDVDLAAEISDIVAGASDMGTLIAWLLGDAVAESLDYGGLFARRWAERLSDPHAALIRGLRP